MPNTRPIPHLQKYSEAWGDIPACPCCGRTGRGVSLVTVRHQVPPDVTVDEAEHYLCMTPECEVAYYTGTGMAMIRQNQLVNQIWFKNGVAPVTVCYCANVTEEEIFYHVAVAQCCSTLEEIQRHTGANTGCECLTKNPSGG